jgi:hypothetical protein
MQKYFPLLHGCSCLLQLEDVGQKFTCFRKSLSPTPFLGWALFFVEAGGYENPPKNGPAATLRWIPLLRYILLHSMMKSIMAAGHPASNPSLSAKNKVHPFWGGLCFLLRREVMRTLQKMAPQPLCVGYRCFVTFCFTA